MIEFLSDSIKLIFGIEDDQPLRKIHVAMAIILVVLICVAIYFLL